MNSPNWKDDPLLREMELFEAKDRPAPSMPIDAAGARWLEEREARCNAECRAIKAEHLNYVLNQTSEGWFKVSEEYRIQRNLAVAGFCAAAVMALLLWVK